MAHIGVILFAHGSRVETANEGVRAVAAELARAGSLDHVEPAFLELGKPDLAEAVDRLVARGAKQIIVLPYFLTLGLHLERDLPGIIAEAASRYPDVEIRATPPLEGHPALVHALLDRWKQAT